MGLKKTQCHILLLEQYVFSSFEFVILSSGGYRFVMLSVRPFNVAKEAGACAFIRERSFVT